MKSFTFSAAAAQLREKNRGQYMLLAGCCFFSGLLITAYTLMMRSPTVLTVLPEGGDSRKQVMLIFALTVVGCGVFTAYASGLFFRYKSRECGIFLALGATRAQLSRLLRREMLLLSLGGCGAGIILGAPLSFLIWQLFRLLVVDTQEMRLCFDLKTYGFSLAFMAYVFILLLCMLSRFLRRTNILDIVRESRTSEPVKEIPRWHGILGIALVIVGAILGYFAPGWIIFGLHWYPPEWMNLIFYLPLLIGLYMILLHTVVYGWHRTSNRYTHLVSTGMMRFQGKQTVLNLLVVTVLVAGAYFAAFYAPVLGVGSYQSFDQRRVDYAFHYRADQSLPSQSEIESMAAEHGVTITDYSQQYGCVLAYDGDEHVETSGVLGTTYTIEYRQQLASCTFLSESAWNALTGDTLNLAPGTVVGVFDDFGNSGGRMGNEISLVTNPLTNETLSVTPVEPVLCSSALFGCRVLDDTDYAAISRGLPETWQVGEVIFNVANVDTTYSFAKALFNEIVDRSGPEVEVFDAWDAVQKMQSDAAGQPYAYDKTTQEDYGWISYDERDSSNFRLSWKYMPQFRVMDKAEFVKTMAVYLMLFIFIAIICFAAVFVILYTRCMTLALNNAAVYSDLRHLGASNAYLHHVAKGQLSQAFLVPVACGTAIICVFYSMILYFNDGSFSSGELSGMLACALLVAVISLGIYVFYRYTLKTVEGQLHIGAKNR